MRHEVGLVLLGAVERDALLQMIARRGEAALMEPRHAAREVRVHELRPVLSALRLLHEPRAQLGRRVELAPDEKELHLLPLDPEALRRVADRLAERARLPVHRFDLRGGVAAERAKRGRALGDQQQLGQLVPRSFPEPGQRVEGLVDALERLGVRRSREVARSRGPAIGERLVPELPLNRVVGQAVELGRRPDGVESLDGLHHAGVQNAPPLVQEAGISHFMHQGMPERVALIGQGSHLVQKLRGLQAAQPLAQRPAIVRNGGEQLDRHVLADHGSRLEHLLVLRGEPVDARGEDRLDCRRYLDRAEGPREAIGTARAAQARPSRPARVRSPPGRAGCHPRVRRGWP